MVWNFVDVITNGADVAICFSVHDGFLVEVWSSIFKKGNV